jgi:hypothetical protein
MAKYRVIYEDPLRPDEPAKVLVPSQNWIDKAMRGEVPPIWVHWMLQDDEALAVSEGRHHTFVHDANRFALQYTAPRVEPMTEEEAMVYLIMKDVPRHIWSVEYNRPMFAIVAAECVPSDRSWRGAWRLAT